MINNVVFGLHPKAKSFENQSKPVFERKWRIMLKVRNGLFNDHQSDQTEMHY